MGSDIASDQVEHGYFGLSSGLIHPRPAPSRSATNTRSTPGQNTPAPTEPPDEDLESVLGGNPSRTQTINAYNYVDAQPADLPGITVLVLLPVLLDDSRFTDLVHDVTPIGLPALAVDHNG